MSIDRSRLVKEWLVAAAPTAKMIGCTPAAVVAQAVLETGWGASAIGNNLFGIKAGASWTGKRQYVLTREVFNGQSVMVYDWFRDYDSPADSFADHFKFLKENGRYAAAGVFDPNDTKSDDEYFEALQRAGYATDPHYAATLSSVKRSVLQFASIPDEPLPWPVLYEGYRDSGTTSFVRQLQRALNEAQKSFALAEDGAFGPQTRRAVELVQAQQDLKVDGLVGPATRRILHLGEFA